MQNSGIVYISSKNAIYNRENLNTYFYDSVQLNFNDHDVNSDEIDMNYISKNLKIAGNVKYNNNRNYLKADVVEMDLLTKISKIYMKNKKSKIMGKIVN